MSAAEFIAVLRRRWYVLVLVVLCTLGAVWRVHERPIAYQGCEVLKAAGPTWSANLNTYGALTRVAAMVTETMMSQPVQAHLLSQGVADYTVEQSDIGEIAFPTYADELRFQAASYPAALVCTTSSSPQSVLSHLAIVTADFRAALSDMQARQHVEKSSLITAQALTNAIPAPIVGRPFDAYLGLALLGLISAVALTLWSDQVLKRLFGGNRAHQEIFSAGRDTDLVNPDGLAKGFRNGHR